MWLYFFAGAAVMAVVLIFCVFVWFAAVRRPEIRKFTAHQGEYEKIIVGLLNERVVLARQRNDDVAETNRLLLLIF